MYFVKYAEYFLGLEAAFDIPVESEDRVGVAYWDAALAECQKV